MKCVRMTKIIAGGIMIWVCDWAGVFLCLCACLGRWVGVWAGVGVRPGRDWRSSYEYTGEKVSMCIHMVDWCRWIYNVVKLWQMQRACMYRM